MRSSKSRLSGIYQSVKAMLQKPPLNLTSHGLDRPLPIEVERIVSGFPTALPPQDLKWVGVWPRRSLRRGTQKCQTREISL